MRTVILAALVFGSASISQAITCNDSDGGNARGVPGVVRVMCQPISPTVHMLNDTCVGNQLIEFVCGTPAGSTTTPGFRCNPTKGAFNISAFHSTCPNGCITQQTNSGPAGYCKQ